MKRISILLALTAAFAIASCTKTDVKPTAEVVHNPLWCTVWEYSYNETPSGEFDSYTDRLLFRTDSTGEIFSMYSIVYYSGDNIGEEWDTTVAMTYRLDTESNDLFITSNFYGNPKHLKYNSDKETLTVVGNEERVYVRVM